MKIRMRLLLCLILIAGTIYSIDFGQQASRLKTFTKDSINKIKRSWACLTNPSNCSTQEVRDAKRWFIYTPASVVATGLAVAGVAVAGTVATSKSVAAMQNQVASGKKLNDVTLAAQEGKPASSRFTPPPVVDKESTEYKTHMTLMIALIDSLYNQLKDKMTIQEVNLEERSLEELKDLYNSLNRTLEQLSKNLSLINSRAKEWKIDIFDCPKDQIDQVTTMIRRKTTLESYLDGLSKYIKKKEAQMIAVS